MEPRISLDTLELEPGERFKLIAPFLVITDRGRAFSAPWSSWRPLRVTPTGVVRAIYQGEVVEGSLGRMVAQAFLGAGEHDLVRRRDHTLGWAASNLHVYPPKAQRLPKPRRPTRKNLESWLKPGERPHHLDDDPELGVVITDQGRVFYLRAGHWVSAAIDAHGRFYVKTPERTFKRKLAKYVARYFMGAKDDEVPVQKPHATGWGVEDLELRSRLQGPQPIVTVTLGFSQEQHQQLVEQWGEQLEAKLKALILDQLPGHDLRSSCIRISARAGLTPRTLASLTGLSLQRIEDILDDPTLEGPARAGWWAAQMESWRSAWLDEPARALVWRWLIEEQYISLNTLAAWERLEPKVLSQQAAALGIDTFRKPNRLTLLPVQELIERQAQGESVAKMAAELGVSAHSVGHYIRQHKKA